MPAVTFDPSRQLDFHFRIGRDGSKTLTFVDDLGADYSLASETFVLYFKDLFNNTILTLTEGGGLTVQNTNELLIEITDTQASLFYNGTYFWELFLDNRDKTWLNGNVFFHDGLFDGVTETTTVTISEDGEDITITISEQGVTNADFTTALALKQNLVNSATALVDASTMDLTAIKHTLSSSSATRTFTISYTGDDITLIVTLSTTSATYTFPATALCVSEGTASGDNTLALSGTSGDKYAIAIKKVGSDYYVVSKNFGQ